MFFTNLLPESLRKQVDKVSIVLVIPSILFVSVYFIVLYYVNSKDRERLTWTILWHILSIVANVLTIVGCLSRSPALYLPYLIVQGLIVITLLVLFGASCIVTLYIAIYEAIAAYDALESFYFMKWLVLAWNKFCGHKDIGSWFLGGIGCFAGLCIGAFFLTVFYDTWQFIKSEKNELEHRRLCAIVEAQQKNMAEQQQPAAIIVAQPAEFLEAQQAEASTNMQA